MSSDAGFLNVLRGSAPYIHAHRDRCFVIALGGEAALRPDFADLIYDIALLHSLGVKVVLVHGARPQIESRLAAAGLQTNFVNGLRVTTKEALSCVQEAVGSLRMEIEALLSTGLQGTPMGGARLDVASGNLVTAKPVGVRKGVDHLHTGEVRNIDVEAISDLLARGSLVLLSPVGYSRTGEIFNLRAEDVACAAATALHADKLLLLHDGPHLHERLNCAAQLSLHEAADLAAGIQDSDRPAADLLHLAIRACDHGIKRCHVMSHDEDGALLQELYSRDGVGTMISVKNFDELRAASIEDIGGIMALIDPLQADGSLVPRGREQLELDIRHFLVMARDGLVTACCALYPHADEAMGELACVAVHSEYRKQGRAEALLEQVERQARGLGIERLFALTTHAAHWFIEHDFNAATVDDLPAARRQAYNNDRNAKIFIKEISA